jgi:hypothetical protein
MNILDENIFIHHVFFWLKDPAQQINFDQLVEGLKILSTVSTISSWHIGYPAPTSRAVIDSSYSISWLLIFKHQQDHDAYQVDPVHVQFIETCSHLWSKVIVHDTIGV